MIEEDQAVDHQILASLRNIENLATVIARYVMRELVAIELASDQAREIYERTGEKTAREIAAEVGIGIATVSRYWTRWEALGLVAKNGSRFRKVLAGSPTRRSPRTRKGTSEGQAPKRTDFDPSEPNGSTAENS